MSEIKAASYAPLEKRAEALEAAFRQKMGLPTGYIEDHIAITSQKLVSDNGAKMVARAWTDPDYRKRLLEDGTQAAIEMGFSFPEWHRKLTVLENTPKIHNVIVCSLCSCSPMSIIGLPPGWYKEFEYRSRLVRQSRSVLSEMGIKLDEDVEIRVWDTTTDMRYIVLPMQPPETIGWSADALAKIVTQDALIGVSRLEDIRS